ncbi:MAG: glycosyltransferase family 4 protein, partial [Patescibacteria group bacterium]
MTPALLRQQKLAAQLAATEPKVRAIYVATYIPRECGIATFTKDLTNAINVLNPHRLADIAALDDESLGGEHLNYPWEVKYKIDQKSLKSFLDAADYINQSSAEIVSIQHEFGIFGGKYGEYVVPFIEAIKKPVVLTYHTVLPSPNEQQKDIIERISTRAKAIVVMVQTAADRLVDVYGVSPKKIVVIPHGIPDITFGPSQPHKAALGYSSKTLISGFGLLGRGKGYEHAIEAMKDVVAKHPNAHLLLLGQTHPVVLRNEGEKYRQSLKRLVKRLGLEKNVEFANRYLSLPEIVRYLQATDIYITPFPGLDQITSATLAYAIGAGKACVSTPYLFAKEVLADDRGLLTEPDDAKDLAEKINFLLDHPRKRHEMARR